MKLNKDLLRRFGGSAKRATAHAKEHHMEIGDLDVAHRNHPKGALGWHKLGRWGR